MIEDRQQALADLREKTERLLPQVRGIRAVPISGQTGSGLDKLMTEIVNTHRTWNRRISTGGSTAGSTASSSTIRRPPSPAGA
jgi:GTP-binding protein